ncbi:dihydroorotase [Fusobacterium sp. MFO224]|uniref:dihydroorotase n=1 Tax=Fusobacterium sp. MFO224 TaxID=3378070 RepID=UPI003854589C
MLIKNGLIFINNKAVPKDILIENEKIIKIQDNISVDSNKNHKIIDAKGKYILPGIIDPHTHMRDPGLTYKEDFSTGSMACAKGGITTFLDMPNTIPNTITEEELLKKKQHSKNRSFVDYAFYFGGSKLDNSEEVKKVIDLSVATKIFMNVSTGNMLVEDEKILKNIFNNSKLVAVHAEGEMVKKAIEISAETKTPLYLCHLSTKKEIEYLKEAKNNNLKVYGEVTPHHLFLNESNLKDNPLLIMKPELKTKEDNEALWEAINEGIIDTIGTDHAPHTFEEKSNNSIYGIPGVENSLELMLQAVKEKKITIEKLIQLMSENPSKIFGLKSKGNLKVGYDADIILVDLNIDEKISDKNIISKCNWTPYKSFNKGGKVMMTIVRGNIVFNNGKFNNLKIGKEVV